MVKDVNAMMNEVSPLYLQLKNHVLKQIRSGLWATGSRVPSEAELVSEFGMSRMTVNRALRELTQDGFLVRVQGVGTFVKELPHRASLIELVNIAEEIKARGHVHTVKVITQETCIANEHIQAAFEQKTFVRLFHILLVHYEQDIPLQIEDRYVEPEVAPQFLEQDFTQLTPTEYLLSIAPVDQLEHQVKAVMPSEDERKLLGMETNEPCLLLNRRSWSCGQVASAVTLTYPASRYELNGRFRTSPAGKLEQSL